MTARTPRAPEPDYTHALHHQRALEVAQRGQVLDKTYVLAQRGPVVYCATISRPYIVPNGPACWTLDTLFPERARLTIPCRNVIACNPEFCSCLPVPAAVGRACDSPLAAGAGPAPELGVLA